MAGTFSLFVSSRGLDVWGHEKISPFVYTGPASYATGGEVVLPGSVKLGTIEWVFAGVGIAVSDGASAVLFVWNPLTAKLQAFWGQAGSASALLEVSNGTVLNGYRAFMVACGKG